MPSQGPGSLHCSHSLLPAPCSLLPATKASPMWRSTPNPPSRHHQSTVHNPQSNIKPRPPPPLQDLQDYCSRAVNRNVDRDFTEPQPAWVATARLHRLALPMAISCLFVFLFLSFSLLPPLVTCSQLKLGLATRDIEWETWWTMSWFFSSPL